MTSVEIRKRAQAAQEVAEAIRAAARSQVPDALKGLISGFHPIDIAFAMGELQPDERAAVFSLLQDDEAGVVLEEVADEISVDLAEGTDDRKLADIIDAMPPDAGADIVELLDEEHAHRVLAHIPREELEELQALRQYGPDTAGGIMTSEVLFAPGDLRAWELLAHLRNSEISLETLHYVYVVDNEQNRRLTGVISVPELLQAEAGASLADFMHADLVSIGPEADQQEAVRLVDQYDLAALPVVDETGRLLGTVTVDDIIDAMQQEYNEDLSAIAGTSADDLLSQSGYRVAALRLPWLAVCFLGTMVSAAIVTLYGKQVLASYLPLAAFMPVNAAMAGNAGLQTSTIMVRALALGHVGGQRISRVLARQFGSAVLIALACGVMAGAAGALFMGRWELGLVAGASMLFSVMWATSTGATIPLLFARIGVDPAVSAGPLVTTANDSVSLLIYFGLATMLLHALGV